MTESDLLHEEPPAYAGSAGGAPVVLYLRKLAQALKRGDATEHTYRPALKQLLETFVRKSRRDGWKGHVYAGLHFRLES